MLRNFYPVYSWSLGLNALQITESANPHYEPTVQIHRWVYTYWSRPLVLEGGGWRRVFIRVFFCQKFYNFFPCWRVFQICTPSPIENTARNCITFITSTSSVCRHSYNVKNCKLPYWPHSFAVFKAVVSDPGGCAHSDPTKGNCCVFPLKKPWFGVRVVFRAVVCRNPGIAPFGLCAVNRGLHKKLFAVPSFFYSAWGLTWHPRSQRS